MNLSETIKDFNKCYGRAEEESSDPENCEITT